MSKITFTFRNFCAFFSKKLNDQLMVGLLDLADFYGVPAGDVHSPTVTIESEKYVINPNGEIVAVPQNWTYAGFGHSRFCCTTTPTGTHDMAAHDGTTSAPPSLGTLSGKILLEVHGLSQGLSQDLSEEKITELTALETNRRRGRGARKLKDDEEVTINPFDNLLDFQRKLHDNEYLRDKQLAEQLVTLPDLCRAQFYFQHGLLYTISLPPFDAVAFEPQNPEADGLYADETGLEIELPQDGYAVLRFLNSDVQDFVFQGAGQQHYFVTVDNAPLEHPQASHFSYYYKLVAPPHRTYIPQAVTGPNTGDPFCRNNGFGDGDYDDPPPSPPTP